MKFLVILIATTFAPFLVAQNIVSPAEYASFPFEKYFTPHHKRVDYFKYVAENSKYVELSEYGMTYEFRPLILAVISDPENLSRIDEIRTNNLRRTGLIAGEVADEEIAIVWMSYGVHGNESSSPEAAMKVLYALAQPDNDQVKAWLKNTIVLIDPCVNPDGNSRYTHWNNAVSHQITTTDINSREHQEPWPGGRVNHYLFDLNRDWAWISQIESKARIAAYHRWMPHVHIDFHEMGINSPYYFAPAARPYHSYITDWQSEFQVLLGANHTRYFDENGWLYFTKEVFDLFYPSYGDTYPTFSGAIGATYEQGGSGKAGVAVKTETGDTLTLTHRILHHFTASMSTIEVASNQASRLIQNFTKFFDDARWSPFGKYQTFVIPKENSRDKLKALTKFFDNHFISYGTVKRNSSIEALHYGTFETKKIEVDTGDLVISALQPKGVMAQILLEPRAELEDSVTYDITAWSLPLAYGLEAYASESRLDVTNSFKLKKSNINLDENAYAYLIPWQSVQSGKVLGKLMQSGINVRIPKSGFSIEGEEYSRNTLIITRGDNRALGQKFHQIVKENVESEDVTCISTQTGRVAIGSDFGSNSLTLLKAPKTLLLSGKGVDPNSFGFIWYYFEQTLEYPLSIIKTTQLSESLLEKYNTLIIPSGNYPDWSDRRLDILKEWISVGGKLIVVVRALTQFTDKAGFALTEYFDAEAKASAIKTREEREKEELLDPYNTSIRKSISNFLPGAIYKNKNDNTYPLGYGLGEYYFSLKTNSLRFDYLKDALNVIYIEEEPIISGFVGANKKEELLNTFTNAVQPMGWGHVIYMVDDPLFRGFWENGKLLFANALFLIN